MPIHITMNDAVTRGANYLLSQQQISEARRAQIFPATKFNLLVNVFNASSVLLVAAAVSALFLAFSVSSVCFCIGLFLRYTTEKELETYSLPLPLPGWGAVAALVQTNLLRHALHQATDEERINNIFHKVGMRRPENWEPNELLFLDFIAWKNTIVIPQVIEQIVQEIPVAGVAPNG